MKGFVIGRVCEPENRTAEIEGNKVNICTFGLLVGRISYTIDVFSNDELYPRVLTLQDGDQILAVISSYFKEGRSRNYLSAFGECPEGLGEQLRSLVAG